MILLAALLLNTAQEKNVTKFIDKLEKLKNVTFTYRRVLDYRDEKYYNDTTWTVKADLTPGPSLPFTSYVVESDKYGFEGFDGSTLWTFSKAKVVKTKKEFTPVDFDSFSFMRNSIFGLSKALSASLKNDPNSVKMDGKTINWNCGNNRPNISTPLEKMEVPTRLTVELDPKNGLPKKITQFLEKEGSVIVTEFSKWDTKPQFLPGEFGPPGK